MAWSRSLTGMSHQTIWFAIFVNVLAVAFAHDEIERTQHDRHVADHAAGQQFAKDAKIHEAGRADFQAIRRAAALAVDVKTKFALRIFVAEINFAGRTIHAFGHEHELMD